MIYLPQPQPLPAFFVCMSTATNTHSEATPLSFDNPELAFGHKSDKELAFSLFIFRTMSRPGLVKVLTSVTKIALALRLPIGWAIRGTIFRQFCGGESIPDCASTIAELGQSGIGAILDYSVEGKNDEGDLNATRDEILRAADVGKANPHIPVTVVKITGICRFDLLAKVSKGDALSEAETAEYERAKERLNALCQRCSANGVPLYIDAEESWIQPAIDELAEAMMLQYNGKRANVFNTVQLYRHDRLAYLKSLYSRNQQAGVVTGVKLVRGAYLEKENDRAQEHGYRTPMQPDKASTDRDYNAALRFCIDHIGQIEVCAGTHNEQSCLLLTQLMAEKGIPANTSHIYFSQLYGMSDHLSFTLANAGYRVSKYLPYGPVQATVPYLIRRAEENTSIAGQMGQELRLLLAEKSRRKKSA